MEDYATAVPLPGRLAAGQGKQCRAQAAREFALDGRDERIDVGLGGVEAAHPAHLAGGSPVVEAEALAQPVRDAGGQDGEDGVGLGRLARG